MDGVHQKEEKQCDADAVTAMRGATMHVPVDLMQS
jgi:hypothetical protein